MRRCASGAAAAGASTATWKGRTTRCRSRAASGSATAGQPRTTANVSYFFLTVHAGAPLVVTSAQFPVKRDLALPLLWEAPSEPALAHVHIKLDISHHGGKKGEIDCDVPDTGSFEIPAALVTALVDLGLAGYPTIVLSRVASSASSEAPHVAFLVSSSIEREVDTGITSCTEDSQCPADQRCDTDKLTCE